MTTYGMDFNKNYISVFSKYEYEKTEFGLFKQ